MESTDRAICSAVRCLVPLNTMCSTKCEIPVSCSCSSRDPVPIHRPTETLRTWGIRSVTTRTPLPRTCRSISLGRDLLRFRVMCFYLTARVLGVPENRGDILGFVVQTIVGMEVADIEGALGSNHPRYRARQIYQAVYRQRVTDLRQVSTLPKPLRDQLPVGIPEVDRQFDSADGTRRYLLKLADGKTVETV